MLLTFSIITFVVGFLILLYNTEDKAAVAIATIMFFGSLIFRIAEYEFDPSAMDVYQGKTTLEKTYRNNVPIDSTVIYKPGKH